MRSAFTSVRLLVLAAALAGSPALSSAGHAAQPGSPAMKNEALRSAFSHYLATWSSDETFNADSVRRYYADPAIYYGKRMSNAAILAEKQSYVRAWPVRHYALVPGTLSVACRSGRAVCVVTGVMRWSRQSAHGQQSRGSARLSLTSTLASGGRITRESAHILE